ncbi:hypothetical protein ACFUOZ_11135 [Paenarthrobacter sp. NPDC057355]|uniref:hypothetical protein n=1 Tax=Paenarthrobacter sp. NPDC057355 TaxID=3346105 RepID=UPI00363B762A
MSQLMPGACFSLAPGIAVEDGYLRDDQDRRYPLNSLGVKVCKSATKPVGIDELIGALLGGKDDEDIRDSYINFINDLNRAGLVSIHQSFVVEIELDATFHRTSLLGIMRPARPHRRVPLYRRYVPTARSLVAAVVEAHQLTMWLGVAAVVVSAVLGFAGSPDFLRVIGARNLALSVAFLFLGIVGTAYFHELGHLLLGKIRRVCPTSVYVRSGAAGVAFGPMSALDRIRIITAGPLTGLTFVAAIEFLILRSPDGLWTRAAMDQLRLSFAAAFALIGLLQLLGLTPLTKDGRTLLKAILGDKGRIAEHDE